MNRLLSRLAAGVLLQAALLTAADLPSFDFRSADDTAAWRPLHDLASLTPAPEGLLAKINGADPYFVGPPRDYPEETELWLNLELKSDAGGTCQVFYFPESRGATEPESVRLPVTAGEWVTLRAPLPALGPRYRLRLDPPGESGECLFRRLWFEERFSFAAPAWPKPADFEPGPDDPSLTSGSVRLRHHPERWGMYMIEVDGHRAGMSHDAPLLGYVIDGQPRWWSFTPDGRARVTRNDSSIRARLDATDPDGAQWSFDQTFSPGSFDGTIEVETVIAVNRRRDVLHLSPILLFAGVGTTGTNKQQALLAGVEYLENEPSSSEADLKGPQARREVADTLKLTFPLATVVTDNRYLALTWEMRPEVCVLFDSPDRIFASGGHLFGLILPGSDGLIRDEGSLVPYDTLALTTDRPITIHAKILGGAATTVVPVLQHYSRLHEWPVMPSPGMSEVDYLRLAARGWLDSRIRDGGRYRHAVPGPFTPRSAADAAWTMDWLAGRVQDDSLASRLGDAAREARAEVPDNRLFSSSIGHVDYPVAPLVYGQVLENAEAAAGQGRALLRRFEDDGIIRYRASPGAIDYGRTHWTNEASGLTAQAVHGVLEAAAFSGDRELIEAGLRHLRALSRFDESVPRGAQTWEIPLHTPDILASAHLVRAFTLGFELTGDRDFLEAARYWAWTGLPFVYLRNPTAGPIGAYATIPVLGATQWIAPNWIGLPVQWCGLVYAEGLYRLARHDPRGPWLRLADGITASGIQQTYPASDSRYAGLLPDSFSLRPQQRNPANINPATLLVPASQFLRAGPLYDAWSFRRHGVRVHVAGRIEDPWEDAAGFKLRVSAWPRGRHWILMNGFESTPVVLINGREVSLEPPHHHQRETGRLLLQIEGSASLEVRCRE